VSQHPKRPSRRERRRRLWKALASPRTALWAAPALLLPLLAIGLIDDERSASPIEQTIEALPVPVDQEAGTQPLSPGATPLGAAGTRLPTSVTMPIYNNSAQALAARMALTNVVVSDESQRTQDEMRTSEYDILHPRERMMDDLLVGQVNTLLTSPVAPDISVKIFQEYCNARPGDPYYGVDVTALPIDRDLLSALVQLARLTPDTGFCPRVAAG
jgi:hypothetical protein